MNSFALLLIPTLVGALAIIAILHGVPMKHKGLFLWGASLPTGFGLISLVVFASFLIMPSAGKMLSMFGIMLLMVVFLILAIRTPSSETRIECLSRFQKVMVRIRDFFHTPRPGPILRLVITVGSFLIFLLSLSKALQFQTLALPSQIFGGWDARYIWMLKAKFIFQSPAEWQLLFSPQLSWAHPDYPLLLPNSIAWGWQVLGTESLLWGPAVAFGFYVSCAFLLVWYLAEHVSAATGWMAGAFFALLSPYWFWTLQQYADVPAAFFLTAGGLVLVTAFRTGDKKLFGLAGLMAGFAAWTKNEGLAFIVWTGLILAGVCLKRYLKKMPHPFMPLVRTLLGAALPLVAVLILKIFLGTSGDDFESKRTIANYIHLFFSGGSRFLTTLGAFWTFTALPDIWNNLWRLFVVAICFLPFKGSRREGGYDWVIFVLILLINFGYFLAIYLTPGDLPWQIQTALSRLILHSGILVIAFSFETLTFRRSLPKSG